MKRMTAKEVEKQLNEGNAINLIDVREADEVAQGMIPDAKHIPLNLIEFRMNELDKEQEYVMVCRSGGRSGRATQFLEQKGFDVINMEGGMMSWEGKTQPKQ